MSTEQSYVGKGRNATPTEQTVKPAISVAQNQAGNLSPIPTINPNRIQVNQDVHEGQCKLIDVVADFMAYSPDQTPIDVLNDLLFQWLTLPQTQLSSQYDKNRLRVILSMTAFFSNLRDELHGLDYIRDEAEKLEKKVSHE